MTANDLQRIAELEKSNAQLKKEVAELREAIQPEKLAAVVSEQFSLSVRFNNRHWPKVAAPILPKD